MRRRNRKARKGNRKARKVGRFGAGTVACGLLLAGPAAQVNAAELDTDLVVNGGFENVDTNQPGINGSVRILDWSGVAGFAYNYGQNYDNGGPLAGGGTYYFTPNASLPDITAPGQFFQDIDVSTGPSAAAIAAGLGQYNLSAFMSSYMDEGDFGSIHADFRDGVGSSLGFALISDNDPSTWTLVSASGLIPVNTATVRLSVFGTAIVGGPDGFVDNVLFSVSQVPEPSTAALATIGLATAGLVRLRRRSNGP